MSNQQPTIDGEPATLPWPDSQTFWREKRVTVTGGSGFLGGCVVEKLRERGATEICVPRKRDYDLVQREAVLALLHDARPHLIIHLAASVGGIGANLAHQAEFFYDNCCAEKGEQIRMIGMDRRWFGQKCAG